jgi:predicted CoA-binding protein
MVLSDKVTLVLGASANPDRVSYEAVRILISRGIPVVAVGRKEYDMGDVRILAGRPEIAEKIHTVTLYLSAANQVEYYDYILSLEPKRIIFNPGTINPELAEMATINGILCVEACMLVMLKTGEF